MTEEAALISSPVENQPTWFAVLKISRSDTPIQNVPWKAPAVEVST